jgi:hypothetical protein
MTRTSLRRTTGGVAAIAMLAVLAGSSSTGSQAFASTAGAPPVTATGDCDSIATCYRTIGGYHAAPGWDPATGWGSPDAGVLAPLLVRSVHPGDGRGL